MEPVKVCFTPDAAELGRIQAAFSKVRPRLPMGFAIAIGFIFVLQGVLNLSSHRVLFLDVFRYFSASVTSQSPGLYEKRTF